MNVKRENTRDAITVDDTATANASEELNFSICKISIAIQVESRVL